MTKRVETAADAEVRGCLDRHQSFALVAGAGAGKTSSLVEALKRIREQEGSVLRQNGQRVACITFTKRAVEVIKDRLGFDELYWVSTLHSFLWDQIRYFQHDIREALCRSRLPALIAKERAKDNGKGSRTALEARAKAERFEKELESLIAVENFEYQDARVGNYSHGQLGHDDIIEVAVHLFAENPTFRRITGLRFPYIFVDEAQDTARGILEGLNLVCAGDGLPIVGYFGDPWQQIYDGSAGTFAPPANGKIVSKTENFRCSESVIRLLNAFRNDVEQFAAGENKGREGSVLFRLVRTEAPEMPRNVYSSAQICRALARMDAAIADWGWNERSDVVRLFLVRQMIARRMGFSGLNSLFNGLYASSRAADSFDAGEHFLLLPLTTTIWPLVAAHEAKDGRQIIDLLRRDSPALATEGPGSPKTLSAMIDYSLAMVDQLSRLWARGTIREVLQFCVDKEIIRASEKLREHLERAPRSVVYDESIHQLDKGDWLADEFFAMDTKEVSPYENFINNNSAYSTQHGVKGEEYSKVLVVYDDIEANWHNYSFAKILTPEAAGRPTEGQKTRGQKLAYVSFSRALEDLRVLFFTADPDAARKELVSQKLLRPEQIELAS